ncbi:hypothetical protein T484DRAFT_1940922 [Baffinella frigidus]|nr:hypothetical protein T484DRAFT_1940922 [Cryptophyta sp. CCMP2293]
MGSATADQEERQSGHQSGGGIDAPAERSKVWQAGWFPLFSVSSIAMVLLNKYCAASFRQPFSLLGFQNTMTILLNLMMVKLGIFEMKSFTREQFRMFLIPSVLFVGALLTSLKALPLVSVSTTVIFRALTTCLIATGDFFVFRKRFNNAELGCLGAVVVGAFVYAAHDLSFDGNGYTWLTVNVGILVASALYEKHAIVSVDQTPVGISCVQNVLSIPIIVVFGMLVGHEHPLQTLETTGTETRVAMLLTGVAGCSLSIASMSLGKFASATAISLAGNFNRVVSIMAGAALFSDPLSLAQAAGLSISMTAIYGFSQGGKLPVFSGRKGLLRVLALGTVTSALVSFSAAHGLHWKEVVILGRRAPSPSTLGAIRLDGPASGWINGSNGNGPASGKNDGPASGKFSDGPASGKVDGPTSGTALPDGPASAVLNGSSAVKAMAPMAMVPRAMNASGVPVAGPA